MKRSTSKKITASVIGGLCVLLIIIFVVLALQSNMIAGNRPAPFGTEPDPDHSPEPENSNPP